MTPRRIAAKFFVSPDPGKPVDLRPFTPLFHRFIQRGSVEGLLVDVADYAHVPEGPGIVLIGHEVDYGIDLGGGQAGLLVTRKRYGETPLPEILRDTLRKGLIAIREIEADGSTGLRFATDRLGIRFLDRLAAPDREEAFQTLGREIAPVLGELFGAAGLEVTRAKADREGAPLCLSVVSSQTAERAGLSRRLGGAAEPAAAARSDWEISVEALKQLREEGAELVLIDVREPHENAICNLGGRLIPLGTLEEKLDELDRSARIVVHCRGGGRGAKAVGVLREAGFENAWNLRGGILAWIDRIDPSLTRY